MRIILAGIIGRYPWGGVTWCSLMYLLGLRALGHDVYYLEDTSECNYDPDEDTLATDPHYALHYIHDSLSPFDLGDRWCYVDYTGKHHGIGESQWKTICASTDLLLVLSGGCWTIRDHYRSIPCKAFIDSDPAFTQLAIDQAARRADEKSQWYVDYFRAFDRLFTFGANVGTPHSNVPTGEFKWIHTWQPVCMDLWTPRSALPRREVWTTVMTWKIESFQDIGGNKDQEFLRVIELAKVCQQENLAPIELAINGPREFLREQGWNCVDAFAVSRDLWRYHNYLSSSRAEFSVAKQTYVKSNSGWFSDRTECYLAAGCPVVVQETGFSRVLPVGKGLFSWNTLEEAVAGMREVEGDWPLHSAAAHEIAHEHFDATKVLGRLLDACQ